MRDEGKWRDGLRWINKLSFRLGHGATHVLYHPLHFLNDKLSNFMEDRLPMAVSGGTTSLAWLEEEVAVWG